MHQELAAGLAAAVARRDPQWIADRLTAAVRLRALLPGGVVEAHGPVDVAACLCSVVADFDAIEVVESAAEDVADRLLVHYRLHLARATARWVCTQTAVCTTVDGRLSVIDLLCSGFRRIPAWTAPPRRG